MVEHRKDESFERYLRAVQNRTDSYRNFLSNPDNIRKSNSIGEWFKELYFREYFSTYDLCVMTGLAGNSINYHFKQHNCKWSKGTGYFRGNKCAVWKKDDCNAVFDNCIKKYILDQFRRNIIFD